MDTDRKKEQFCEQLPLKNFHVAKTCKAIGISRSTYYLWLEKDSDFEEQIEHLREQDLDDSEETLRILRRGIPELDADGKFIGWISRPDTTAVIFHLKTKGKQRGYVEKQEFDMTTKPPDIILNNVSEQFKDKKLN